MSKKFNVLICLLLLLSGSFSGWAQQNKRLTVQIQNGTILDCIKSIEGQTDCTFLFSNSIGVDKKVNINCVNQTLDQVLTAVFSLNGIAYDIQGNQITLRKEGQTNGSRKIHGRITDRNGEPVIGASIILLEDQTKGTITDENGDWSLDASTGNTLRITSIGMKSVDRNVDSSPAMDIVMEEDINLLDDAVVIGYGTARKGDLTGSISSVKGEVVSERSAAMVSNALQGQIAGVQVTRSNGAPGSSGTIRIHGITTMSDNTPLVIVDGVPGQLDFVMADDIQDISVMKDAAAASIYGSRAAAGVIIVTTKRAQKDKFSVDYGYSYGIDTPTTIWRTVSAEDYMKGVNDLKFNDGASSEYSEFTKEYIENYAANHAKDPIHYPYVDNSKLFFKDHTNHQQHTLTISGGRDNLMTKASLNYYDAEGYYKYRGYERLAARINNDWQITKWLKAYVDLDLAKTESTAPAANVIMANTYLRSPVREPVYWEDGRIANNEFAGLEKGGTSTSNTYRLGGKIQFDITPLKNLTITTAFSPRIAFTKGKTFLKQVYWETEDGSAFLEESHRQTNLTESRNDNASYTYQAFANYSNKWGDHSFNAMVGYEGYKYEWENLGASRTNYTLDSYPYLNLGPEDYQFNSGSAGHNAYQSGFSRLMYSFKNRYMVQANFRADGSSRFAKECRWGYFPSVSAGWVISEEPWFKNNVISYLKLRGSWGKLGNERIGSEFPYQATMTFGNSYRLKKDGSVTAVQNAAQVYYAFHDITWETTTSIGIGIDANFFDGRLRFTGDYYSKKTENMLLTLGFPSYAGFSAPQQNAGDMYTKGWDIELGWNDRIGDFSYGISANLSDYRSKMGYVGDKRTISGNYLIEKGSFYNEWFLYPTDGLIMTEADMYDESGKKIPVISNNVKPGDIKFLDVAGGGENGDEPDGKINGDDRQPMGNSLPEYIYGGNIFMGWKNLDFSLSFQGVGHQQSLFHYYWLYRNINGPVSEISVGKYWRVGDDEANKTALYPRISDTMASINKYGSEYWLFNGAYFRVKNISLGYTIPKNLMERTFIKNLRLYANIVDLPAISNYPKGWDPEISDSGDFISTSFVFGVNVKF